MAVLRSALFNLYFYVCTAVLGIAGLPLLIGPQKGVAALARFWCLAIIRGLEVIVGLRYRLRGHENIPPEPAIFAVKHQSAWETFALNVILDRPVYVLKRELKLIPLFGWFAARSGMIAVDRAAGPRAMRTLIREAGAALAAGRSIVIFPEGTRTAPGEHRPYHPGVAALYTMLDRPVVPVALDSGLYWPRRSFIKRPGTVILSVLPPIRPGLDRQAFLESLQTQIEAETDALIASTDLAARQREAVPRS